MPICAHGASALMVSHSCLNRGRDVDRFGPCSKPNVRRVLVWLQWLRWCRKGLRTRACGRSGKWYGHTRCDYQQRGCPHLCQFLCGANGEWTKLFETVFWRVQEKWALLVRKGKWQLFKLCPIYEQYRTFFPNKREKGKHLRRRKWRLRRRIGSEAQHSMFVYRYAVILVS